MPAQTVEAHERPHPMDVGLLGPYAVMQITDALTHLIEQARRLQRRQRRPDALHGGLVLDGHPVSSRQRQSTRAFRGDPFFQVTQQRAALRVGYALDITLCMMNSPIDAFVAKQRAAFVAFREALSAESDRGCALFAAAYLDRALSDLLFVSLVSGKKIEEDLFKSNAPLSSFSSRIKMAYYLGKLSASARRDLETIRSVRNAFAHHPEYLDFEVQSIKDRCANLVHVWHEPDTRPRGKFTAAVSGLLAMVHLETLQAAAPSEKQDKQVREEDKKRIRTMATEVAEKLPNTLERDLSDDEA